MPRASQTSRRVTVRAGAFSGCDREAGIPALRNVRVWLFRCETLATILCRAAPLTRFVTVFVINPSPHSSP
jgi:hypothetical protein